MASERGYTSQVMPQSAPGPVLADANSFGGGIAQQLGQLGDTVNAAQMRSYQLDREQQRQSQSADFFHRFATARQNLDGIQTRLRSNPAAPGGQGHVEATQQVMDAQAQDLFNGITEESVLREARQQWDAYATGQVHSASDWAEGQRIVKVTSDTAASKAQIANTVNTSTDPSAMAEGLRAWYGQVNGLSLPPDIKQKLLREGETEIAVARIDNLNRSDPKASVALIDAGAYNAFLEPQQLQAMRRQGDVEIRRLDAQQRQQTAFEKAQINQSYELLKGQAGAGLDIDVGQAATLAQRAEAVGDPVKAQELRFLVSDQAYVRQYRVLAQNPVEMQQHIAALAGKAHPSAAEQQELGWAREHANGLVSRFTGDPVGYMAQFGPQGTQPPQIDPTNPQTLQARAQWRANMAATSGRPDLPMFSDAEIAPIRQILNTGDTGRMQVLGQLDGLDDANRQIAARQIAPDDKPFQYEAQLRPDGRKIVQSGREIQKGNAGFWPSNETKLPLERAANQRMLEYDNALSTALRDLSAKDLQAVKGLMRDYVAGKYANQGKGNAHGVTTDDLREAATYALGGQVKNGQQYGGLGQWGPARSFLVIPENMTGSQLASAFMNDRASQDKRGTGPVNVDGHTPFDLKQATPIYMGGGQYRWEVAGKNVNRKDGSMFVSRVGAR